MIQLPYLTPLTPDEQRAAGLPEVWPLAIADRVRFAELDPLNHVNNVAYLVWLETARVAYFKHIKLSAYEDATVEPRIVIRRAEMDWVKEMRAEEDYIIGSRTIAYRNTSFTMYQEIWSGGTKRAAFSSVVVLLQPDGSARYPLPDHVISHFHEVDGVTTDQQ